ncbi:MAG: alpha-1,6-glucosidase domain-containing protein, partial [Thermoanaerobaculia bacterium]
GVGLPPRRENGAHWDSLRPLLANPALRPSKDDILFAVAHLREVLAIRKSSPLFRLRSGADVLRCVTLLNGGPSPIPGLIVVALRDEDGSIDREHDLVAVLFNAAPFARSYTGSIFVGKELTLHPIQMASQDPIVRTSSFHDGTLTIPGRTAAVFWQQRK